MIRSFRHRGLRELYTGRSAKRVAPEHVGKLRSLFAVLDRARGPEDVSLRGVRVRQLKGALSGHWAAAVSANWRVTFRFHDGDVHDVDYVDYH